jgi:hypothetical protein
VRFINLFSSSGFIYAHCGMTSGIQRYAIEQSSGVFTSLVDRTPIDYVANANNLWQIDTIYLTSGGATFLFAAPTPSLFDLTSSTPGQVYYGDPLDTTPLIPAALAQFTASISGTVMTVTASDYGTLSVGDPVTGAGVTAGTEITEILACQFTGEISGNTLTVTAVDFGSLDVGMTIDATGSVAADTVITSFGTGSGGTGTYNVTPSQTVSSQAMTTPSLDTSEIIGRFVVNNSQTVASEVMTSGSLTTSGGLICVGPFLVLYGQDGLVQWSAPANPLDFSAPGSGSARPVPDKIVKGLPLRGSSAPAMILWSLSACVVANFVGGATFWSFTTVSTSTSILSANCVVEHNGIYFWASTTGFQRFAGVMEDLPNEYNQDFFLSNLNFSQRQKVFAVKVPRWNEIWWCCPMFGATECNHAIIYNYEKNYWYDTPLPNTGRAAGTYDDTYNFPLMSGVVENNDTNGYSIWQHELGLDEVSGPQATAKAIISFYETHEFSFVVPAGIGQPGQTFSISYSALEPDFSQIGPLTLEIFSRQNPGETKFVSPTDPVYTLYGGYPIPDPATITDQENNIVDFKWTARITSFVIQSNSLGGDYFAGSPLLWVKPSDQRRTG